jgi:hypothetical protein
MRANVARRDNWAQIRIGACALLLPPVTLGAAFYSMLAAPDGGAARPSGTAAKIQLVRPELLRDETPAWAVGPTQTTASDARQQPSPASAEDVAWADSGPAQVNDAPLGKLAGSPAGARLPEPSWPAPTEASTALPPRPLAAPSKAQAAPLRMTAQTPAAHAPSAAAPPSAEGPAASPPSARKRARSETAAARRSTQRSEHAFSFKDWLQQLGIVSRNTRS